MLDSIVAHGATARIFDLVFIQPVPYFGHGSAFVIHPESFGNEWGCERIGLKTLILIDPITNRDGPTGKLAL